MNKTVKFLDFMVKSVFISTFIFTIIAGFFIWKNQWENVAIVLVEKWFTIMIGELLVMGFIQMVKDITLSKIRLIEEKLREEKENKYNEY